MRYDNFMQDTQEIEFAVCALAPRWGDYYKRDLDGLRATLYQLDRIALMVATLATKVEADVNRETEAKGGERFENEQARKLWATVKDFDRDFIR